MKEKLDKLIEQALDKCSAAYCAEEFNYFEGQLYAYRVALELLEEENK